jgi:hypothetical protein
MMFFVTGARSSARAHACRDCVRHFQIWIDATSFRYVGTGSRNLTVETLLETGKEVPGEVSRLPEITFSQSQPLKVFEQFFPKPKAATPPKETKSWRYSPPRGTSPVPQHWRPY